MKTKTYWKKLIDEWKLRFPEWKVYAFDPELAVAKRVGDNLVSLPPELVEDILCAFLEDSIGYFND